MITTYILTLALSSWLVSLALSFVAGRLTHAAALPFAGAHGVISLMVAIGFLVAAAAPGWVLVIALALLAMPSVKLPPLASWLSILLALLPLIATSLLGAPSWVALDSALIAASLLGAAQARGADTELGRAWLPYVWLVGWLAFTSIWHISGLHGA